MIQLYGIKNEIKPINIINKGKNMNLSDEIASVIERVKSRVEREIPDKGFFRNFAENFNKEYKPEFFGKDIALFVERDSERDGRAFVGVAVLHPTQSLTASTYLMNGNRDRILEYLNNESFKSELEKTVLELSESLKKQG